MGLSIWWEHPATIENDRDFAMAAASAGRFPERLARLALAPEFSISYGGFSQLRTEIVACFDVELVSVAGFGGDVPVGEAVDASHPLVHLWPAVLPLIDHSDCDGVLTGDECGPLSTVLPVLAQVIEDRTLPDDDTDTDEDEGDGGWSFPSVADQVRSLAALCEVASRGGLLRFG